MINWITGLFSKKTTDKALGTAIDGLYHSLDKIWYTSEEKADEARKIQALHLDLIKATADESSARSITRRIIAVLVIGVFLFSMILSGLVYPWSSEWAAHLLGIAASLSNIALAISIFYFGYYGINNVVKTYKNE